MDSEQENNITVYSDKIDLYIHEFYSRFCEDDNLDSYILKSNQNTWYSCCRYIYNNIIANNKYLLKVSNNINNQYDIDKVNQLLDIYIYYCFMYDKEINAIGFQFFSGIQDSTFHEWETNKDKVSLGGSEIINKIRQFREQSLSAKLVTGKQNPLGVFGVLKRWYGWDSPYISEKQTKQASITASELPKLSAQNSQNLRIVDNAQTSD